MLTSAVLIMLSAFTGGVACVKWMPPLKAAQAIGIGMVSNDGGIKFANLGNGATFTVRYPSNVEASNTGGSKNGYLKFRGTDKADFTTFLRFDFVDASTGYKAASLTKPEKARDDVSNEVALDLSDYNNEFQRLLGRLLSTQ